MQISRVVKFIRKGEKGDGVVSTEIRYVISLNGTTPPLDQSNWTESIPTLIKGRYLWTRTILTYSDGSKSYSYTVSYIAKDGEKGEKGEKGEDGKDGANYLPPVWWDSEVKYVNSGFGIPVVKLEDGTTLGYSVYALTADESPAGYTPSGYPEIWRLMESSEYMFLQEAYIEKLQAELVTAERIEALTIKTENLEVLDGSKLGSLFVSGGKITSYYSRNEIVWDYRTYPPTQVGSIPVSGSLEVSVDGVQITKNHFLTFNTTTIEGDRVVVEKDSLNYKNTVKVTPGTISIIDTPKDSGSERRVDITSEGIYINGVKRL